MTKFLKSTKFLMYSLLANAMLINGLIVASSACKIIYGQDEVPEQLMKKVRKDNV